MLGSIYVLERMEEMITKLVVALMHVTIVNIRLLPVGLLHSLPIPYATWEDTSMDFVMGLPKYKGYDVILVVVDK